VLSAESLRSIDVPFVRKSLSDSPKPEITACFLLESLIAIVPGTVKLLAAYLTPDVAFPEQNETDTELPKAPAYLAVNPSPALAVA
jgi:hypothetical protein